MTENEMGEKLFMVVAQFDEVIESLNKLLAEYEEKFSKIDPLVEKTRMLDGAFHNLCSIMEIIYIKIRNVEEKTRTESEKDEEIKSLKEKIARLQDEFKGA